MLKHVKLFESSKNGYLYKLQRFKFSFFPHDVDILDKDGVSPLVISK
jgi:hypothetical protein